MHDARGTADPFNVPAQASDAPLTHQTHATTRPVTKRTAVTRSHKLLPEFDRHLLCLYLREGRTQAEISNGLQISSRRCSCYGMRDAASIATC
jgi:DNA-directed RNA polymerase specialized sigma subunit